MSRIFDWHEHGRGLEVHREPGGAIRVEVFVDRGQYPVEVSERALVELRRALVDVVGDDDLTNAEEALAETEADLARAERQRDEALERVGTLEAELRRVLAERETLRTALDLADTRTRALETLVERLNQDAETGEYRGGSYAREVLVDVSRRVREVIS